MPSGIKSRLVELINPEADSNVPRNDVDAFFDYNLTIQGNLTVTDKLTVNGTTTTSETETVQVEDNMIIVNNGESGAGVTSGEAGLDIDRGTLANYRFEFKESNDTFRIGEQYVSFDIINDTGLTAPEEIVGGTSGAIGKVFDITAGVAKVNMISVTPFQNGEEITGSTSNDTADIDSVPSTTDDTQAVATREDTPVNTGIPIWNNTTKKFETKSDLTTDGSTTFTVYDTIIKSDSISINTDASGNRSSELNLVTDDVNTTYGFQFKKAAGENGAGTILLKGTGGLTIKCEGAASLALGTSNTDRLTIDSNGNVAITGNLDVQGSTKAAGVFYTGTTDPTNSDRLNFDGNLYATKVYGAVWNDYADYWKAAPSELIVPGCIYIQTEAGLQLCRNRADKRVVGICSDTYGMAIGDKKNSVPIAIGGFVLAHIDKEYPVGTLLVAKGIQLTKAKWYEILLQKPIAKYIKPEFKKIYNKIDVNGRHWVKVI